MKRLTKLSTLLLLGVPLVAAGAVQAQLPFDPFFPTCDYDNQGNLVGCTGGSRDPATATKFNLLPPGARSLAMGGAFVGLADDATAAYTNPAGLTNLALGGSEVAVEVRQSRFTAPFTDRGHYPTSPEFSRPLTFIGQDSVEGTPLSEAQSETSGLSFLSFGYVLPGGLTVAFYRHELANFKTAYESQGPFNDFPSEFPPGDCRFLFGVDNCDFYRIVPQQERVDLEIINFGASAAYAFDLPSLKGLESNLSVGLGFSYYELELEGLSEVFDVCHVEGFQVDANGDPVHSLIGTQICTEDRLPGSFYGPADFSRDNHRRDLSEKGDDRAFGLSLGFLWKLGRQQKWSVGGVFRQGPDFGTTRTSTFGHHGPGSDEFNGPLGIRTFDQPPGSVTVPDVFGLGVAFRTAEGSTKMTFDVNRVRFSQTTADFNYAFDAFVGFDPATGVPKIEKVEVQDFAIPDVTQVHLGFERIVLVVESLFVGTARFGAWHEPFHEPEYRPAVDSPDLRALLGNRPTDDETHLSAGFGLVIKEDYQIDLAVDVSDPVTTFSFSLVKFF